VAGLIALVVVLVILGIAGLWAAGVYNGLVRLRNLVQESWRQIDVELTRRHELIPNLVETVQGYTRHESQVLQAVVEARSSAVAQGASVQQQAVAEGALSTALGRLFAVGEAYPNLKADQNFLALQAELTETEDRVAAGRRFYNANVRELNTRVEAFPSSLFATAFAVRQADYFEIMDAAARQVPAVRFDRPVTRGEYGDPPGPGPAPSGGAAPTR
jgi:LemA protein